MRIITMVMLSMFLSSCGYYEDFKDFRRAKRTGGGTVQVDDSTVPVLSGNTDADVSKYTLKVGEKNEIIIPPTSTVTLQQIEAQAIFSLLRNPSVGSFSEGNIDNVLVITLKALNVPNRTLIPFEMLGIDVDDIQAMILNGASVTPSIGGYFDLGAQGAPGYANLAIIFKADAKTEGTETVTLKLISALTNANATVSAVIDDTSVEAAPPVKPAPEYILRKIPNSNANEGNVNTPTTILLTTAGVETNSVVPWVITGIDVGDIESMTVNGIPQAPALGGSFIVGGQGSAGMVLIFKADQKTEGLETLVLGLPTVSGTPTISVTINDTSTTPPVPPPPVVTYALSRSPSTGAIAEGNTGNVLSIRLKTENVAAGTSIPWTISGTGITAGDIDVMVINGQSSTPALSGNFVIGAQGAPDYASVEIIFKLDTLTEGTETLTFALPTVSGVTPITVQITDTSLTPAVDVIAPLITITNVSALAANNTITVTGTAADNVGVTSITWTNITAAEQGTPTITSYGNVITWSALITLRTGVNELEFKVRDAVGLQTILNYSASGPNPPAPPPTPDTTAPTIQVTEQTGMDSAGVITIYGRATDNDQVASVSWVNSLGGVGSATGVNNTGNTTWFASVLLKVGTNNITFTVKDRANNSATTTLSLVVTGSGQSSFEGPSETEQSNIDQDRERMEREMRSRERERMEEQQAYMQRMQMMHGVQARGVDSYKITDATDLKIPEPPHEVHPCNHGYFVNLQESINRTADYRGYGDWWLLASRSLLAINHSVMGDSVYVKQEPSKVQFYWIQRLSDTALGAYDTAVVVDNKTWSFGDLDAKLDLGYAIVPYYYVHNVHFNALPASNTEICRP